MKSIKRIFVGIGSQVEQLAHRLENHEVVADTIIRDVAKNAARVKMSLKQAVHRSRQLQKQMDDLKEEENTWKSRAKRVYPDNRDKALECIRRLKATQERCNSVEAQLQSNETLVRQLTLDVEKIKTRLRELNQKKQELQSRQSCADSAAAIENVAGDINTDINGVFSRWEESLLESEIQGECRTSSVDDLDMQFSIEEETEDLNQMLQDIIEEGDDHE